MLQTLFPTLTVANLIGGRNGCHLQASSLTLLPDASPFLHAKPMVDPDAKSGERLPYTKPTNYGEDWRASGIVHDFNNLLAIILSHTSIAMNKLPVDSPLRSNLERAARATRRAADLSNQLSLSLSHPPDEVLYAEPNEIVEEVIQLLEPKIIAKAELEAHLEPELFATAISRLRLQQVLMNLLLNAVEAIEELPGHIIVTTFNRHIQPNERDDGGQELPTGYYAVIQVSDTGVGMSQETLNTIFEPFFTTKATGTGVGLSTSLAIIQSYRGILQVFSMPGVGSTFGVLLPALDA
jgi:two-component system cell cycle sensor histidine kinase/response regulator CckA